MAADHPKKRLNGASIAVCSSWDQGRTKKKKLESPKNDLNAKSHISLEWDGNEKKVVAKREQVGISGRYLRPFVHSVFPFRNILADVFAIPQEVFDLENLRDVLSYKVWQMHLSENERNFLMQFLPSGLDSKEVVQSLFAGDNFHFGNPFLKWGSSLCSGSLHPDVVLHQEKYLKAEKRAYCSEMQNYHNDMIECLQKMKEMWESRKDPQLLWKISRLRRDVEQGTSLQARFQDLAENVAGTSESRSLAEEERAVSGDNQNLPIMNAGELKKRKPLAALVEARARKGEKLHNHNIHNSDGAKFMSYMKINKKQLETIKTMKQSGKSIQSKSLNHVLGNIDALKQPYEKFIKEEEKKLQEHWLQLANKDLPAAYANWMARQIQRREMTKCLDHEREKLKSHMEDEDEENHEAMLQHQNEHEAKECKSHIEGILDEEKDDHEAEFEDHNDQAVGDQEHNVQDGEDPDSDSDSDSDYLHYQSPNQISYLSGDHDLNSRDTNLENNHVSSISVDASPDVSDYPGNTNSAHASIGLGVPISSGSDVWSAVSVPNSYYNSTANHVYTSESGLQIEEQRNQLVDLESTHHEENNRKDLLYRQADDNSFHSYPSHDRSGLLHSVFKSPGLPPYNHDQKQGDLDFQSRNNVLMENDQYSGHLPGQLQASLQLEQGQKTYCEGYRQQNISQDIYSEGGDGFLIPRHGHVALTTQQDWPVNPAPAQMSAQLPSHLNGDGLLTQNWFSGDHQVRNIWNATNGASVPSQSIGSNADQSLFSILSECNQLRSSSPLNLVDSTGQIKLPHRNYEMVSGSYPRMNNPLQSSAHQLDCLSGRGTANALMPDNMGWMNLPQNSALHYLMGKPYLRSWKQ